MPVLYYCDELARASIEDAGQAFICADTPSNDKALRKLGERVGDRYSLVLTSHPDSMRGVDYRAPEIMLLVGKSFANARDADQGLKRVGRKGDKCQRILIDGTPLVDPEQEAAYQTKLLDFCRQMNSFKTTCKPLGSLKVLAIEKKAPVTRGGKKTKDIEEIKVSAAERTPKNAEKKPQEPIVDSSGKSTPINMLKKQV
jgi:hypothetical protein